ncbi:DUF5753 domain-containing protein [Saccharopolyspora sp. NPDC047091]|uniref:DUF5753 domain-containing protein n=1 Tax=Saccharopolyspora sp. NPDC047091 TaxID=3155924 RepID=UPI0033DDF9FF
MPGLLQTPEYARAVIGTGNDAEWLLSTRPARQALLTRPDGPSVRFLVDEFALRRVIGGNTATRHQLERLNRVQENPRVRIQVVPRDAGIHAGLDGAFVVLEFPAREPHVYVEARRVGLFLTRPQDVEPFIRGVEDIDSKALCEQSSAKLIRRICEELGEV